MLDSKSVKANDAQLKSLTASIDGLRATQFNSEVSAIENGIEAFKARATQSVEGTGKSLEFRAVYQREWKSDTGEEQLWFTYDSEHSNVLEAVLELPKGKLVLSLKFVKSVNRWEGHEVVRGTGSMRAFVSSTFEMKGGERSEHAKLEGSSSIRLCLIDSLETIRKCNLDETLLSNFVNAEIGNLNQFNKDLETAVGLIAEKRKEQSNKISEVWANELLVNEERLKDNLSEGMTPKEFEERFTAVPASVEWDSDSGTFVNREVYFQSSIVRLFKRHDVVSVSVKPPKRKNSKWVDIVRKINFNGEECTQTTCDERQDIKFSIRAVAAHLTACEMLGGMGVDINL
jgi:hypothetical protein